MDTQTLAEAVLEPWVVPPDRLYRLRPEVYQGMIAHGLLTEHDKVAFQDGLLMNEPTNGTATPLADHLYRISLDLYHGMIAHGLLTPDDKSELLGGLLVKKMTKGAPHITVTTRFLNALSGLALEGWYARKEDPISLSGEADAGDSEPEPDVAVVRGHFEDYATRLPGSADVALVVEVADSSVRDDRAKMVLYARAGIPVAWLVNMVDRVVEVYTQPAVAAKYQDLKVYHPGDHVPVIIHGREIGRVAVSDLLR